MQAEQTMGKARVRANALLIGAFAVLLGLPTIDSWFHLDHASAFNEKRLPASWPARPRSAAGLAEYTRGLESYFNDHFGWRKRLIRWHAQVEIAAFKTESTKEVVLGKDGWLFYSEPGTRAEDHCRGAVHFSEQELADYCRVLEQRRDWLAERGIRYLFVVAPDKQSIYGERLPDWLRPNGARTKLDQFLEYMRTHSTMSVPDLRPALQRARSIAPTYYETDSHWNLFGGLIASEEIIRTAALQMPALRPLSLDSFELKPIPYQEGDLAQMLGVCASEDDIAPQAKPTLPRLIEGVQNPNFVRPTFFTTNTSGTGTVLVFRDSFGTALKPFLGYHFKIVGYIWAGRAFDPALIEDWKPDLVISEMVERWFNVAITSDLPDTNSRLLSKVQEP